MLSLAAQNLSTYIIRSLSIMRLVLIFFTSLLAFQPGVGFSKTILVMGDSISAAYGLEESEGWVSLMQTELQKEHPDIKVVNASISGETTDGGLQRLPAAMERFKPDIVVIELGGNDGLRGQSLKLMRRNLTSMANLVKVVGAQPVLLGMRIPSNYGEYYTERFFNVFGAVALETQSAIVPFFLEPIATNLDYFLEDGVHPNAEAQPILLEPVLTQVNALLEREAATE